MQTAVKLQRAAARWQENSCKQVDSYIEVNFDAILGTQGVTLGYPGIKQTKKAQRIYEQNASWPSAQLFYFNRPLVLLNEVRNGRLAGGWLFHPSSIFTAGTSLD